MRASSEMASRVPTPTLPNQRGPAKNKPTVLVVQNDPYVSALLWTLLNESGFQVVCETSGPVGCKLAKSISPDAVVLDVNLPGINGLEVCRQLKAGVETSLMPVVFCSRQQYLADEAMELGAAAFLAMPGEIIKLPRCLLAILSAAREIEK